MVKYYKSYFQQLAISNADIADTDAARSFFYVKDIYNPDAFDKAIRSMAKTPALILERYRTKIGDGGSRNYRKQLLGRFNILEKTDPGDDDAIDTAFDNCESIADELVAKMREQLQEGSPIVYAEGDQSKRVFFPFENIEVDQIGPIDNTYYGVSVSFFWRTAAQGSSTPDKWSDD